MEGKPGTAERRFPVGLTLEPLPANAAVARRAVADEAARAGLGDHVRSDAQVVVTEGFTNAARHAAGGGGDSVEVHACGDPAGITIVVRDHGRGFRPRPHDANRAGGFGLALIAALADRLELARQDDGGTELRARLENAARGGRHAPQRGAHA